MRILIFKHRWAKWGEDADDLEQEILSEMLRKRVVEKFDPTIYDVVNIRLFMSYVIGCIQRIVYSTMSDAKAPKRLINNIAVSLSQPPPDGDNETQTLADTLDDSGRASGQMEAIVELGQLASYINANHADLTPVMSAVLKHGTVNAAELLEREGISGYCLNKFLTLLRRRNKRQ